MKVKDAMHKGVDWVSPDTPITEIAKLMRAHDIGCIPIGEDDRLVGMVTDRDIVCKGLAGNGFDAGRAIQAGRVWTNCYHAYPAHAAFGGYKQSGVGRETHKMMLDHYQQTKNLLVSYSPKKLGFF